MAPNRGPSGDDPDAASQRPDASPEDGPADEADVQLPADIEAELDRATKQLNLSEDQRKVVLAQFRQLFFKVEQHHHGPSLLHADEVERMERMAPGFAQKFGEALVEDMREENRFQTEEQRLRDKYQGRGMNYGLLIAILLIVGALICAWLDQEEVAIALVGAAALGMVAKFIEGWRGR